LWAGRLNICVPYESIIKNEKEDFWGNMLERYKPDNIVVPDTCDETLQKEIDKRFDVFHVETISKFMSNRVPTVHFGTSIFSFFEQEKFYSNKDTRKRIPFFNYPENELIEDLRYAVTFGSIQPNKTLAITPSFLKKDLTYDTYVNLNEITSKSQDDKEYVVNAIAISEGKILDFWNYTLMSGEKFDITLRSTDKGNVYRHPLIIFGADKLESYLLSILLRSRVANGVLFSPLIFNINSSNLKEELNLLFDYLRKMKCSMVNTICLTEPKVNIGDYVDLKGFTILGLSKENILDKLNAEFIFKHDVRNVCSIQKHMQILIQKPEFFNILNDDDYYIAEISFEGLQIPYKKELNERYFKTKKLSANGISMLTGGSRDEKEFIMMPDVDSILYTLMVHKEICPKDTAVRRKMRAISEYFESFWDLDIFSAKELKELIYELRNPNSREYDYRVGMSHGDICKIVRKVNSNNAFPIKLTDYFLAVLINKKIIFRGKEISCPNCHLKEWKLIDDLKNINSCKGCGGSVVFDDASKTHWTYKLNQLFIENFDFTVFLTLVHQVGYKHPQIDNVIGYNFGFRAEIKNEELNKKLNRKEVEFDFSVIAGGKITIGECKQNPDGFNGEVINNAIEFSKFIGIDRLVFSSLGNLDALKQKFKGKDFEGLEIVVLDENDLLYISAYLYHQMYEFPKDGQLLDLNKRREEFIKQFDMIRKDRARSPDSIVIGDYFNK
jgi:hypothetical protein